MLAELGKIVSGPRGRCVASNVARWVIMQVVVPTLRESTAGDAEKKVCVVSSAHSARQKTRFGAVGRR